MLIQPVILSGGAGTRLWPASRQNRPKPFLPLLGENTLLHSTLARVGWGAHFTAPMIVGGHEHSGLIKQAVVGALGEDGMRESKILLEPIGRNTAACVAMAALDALGEGAARGEAQADILQLVLAADHHISDETAFLQAVQMGVEKARAGGLVTFGIVPDCPETGYGYIRRGAQTQCAGVYMIAEFKEKPDAATAQAYCQNGAYLWNSGMFLWSPAQIIKQMRTHCPEILSACEAAFAGRVATQDGMVFPRALYEKIPSAPIDVAVMEKTKQGCVVPADFGWSDIGSWAALYNLNAKDEAANVTRGDVVTLNAKGNYVQADKGLVVLAGVENLVVVQTDDALMIVRRDDTQAVKQIVEILKQQNRLEAVQNLVKGRRV